MLFNPYHPESYQVSDTTAPTKINSSHSSVQHPSDTTTTSTHPPTGPSSQPAPKKVHPCPWEGCERYFACQHNVKQHIREKHTYEKPFQCAECARQGREVAFARQFGLNRHMANVHKMRPGPWKRFGPRQELREPKDVYNEVVPVKHEGPGEFNDMARLLQAAIDDPISVASVPAQLDAVGDLDGMAASLQADVAPRSDWQTDQTSALESNGGMVQDCEIMRHSGQAYHCFVCGKAFATTYMVLDHLHGAHNARSSRLCECTSCQMTHFAEQDDKVEHAQLLRNGGFGVKEDGGKYDPSKLTTPVAAPDVENELPDSAFGDLFLNFEDS